MLRCRVDVLRLPVLVSLLRFLPLGALLGTCKNPNPISVNWKEMNTIHMHRTKRALLQNLDGYILLLLLIHLLLTLCCLGLLSVRLLSFGALPETCRNRNPISVNWKEMNTIHMHRIERAVLQNFAWLPFAVAPHPLSFDALPPPPSFCPPPIIRWAPGHMQKTKSNLRQLERNEHDTYAQNPESGTAEICMVTFCCCSSSTCF